MERASRGLRTARRGAGSGLPAQWAALAGGFEVKRFPAIDARCVEVTDWLLRQLMGEKVVLPEVEGRQIIRMGIGQQKNRRSTGTELREVILEILTEFGEMSTGQLFDELQMQSWEAHYDSVYSILKKMERAALIDRKMQKSAHGGKGIAIWCIGGKHAATQTEVG